MIRSDDPRIERCVVDGQTLLLPTSEAWAAIRESDSLDGRPIAVGRMLDRYLSFAEAVPDLEVALGEVPEPDKPWWVYHVVCIEGRRRRVKPERQACNCGWSGTTGIHREYAIYIGTGDPLATLKSHWDAALVGCPKCGAAFEKPAIWVRDA